MIEIQVKDLVKSFEVGRNVLDGLTFQIDQGERVGLLGRNGAGKTTLFKILTGELDYDEGQVTVGQGRRVGLILPDPGVPCGLYGGGRAALRVFPAAAAGRGDGGPGRPDGGGGERSRYPKALRRPQRTLRGVRRL